MNGCSTLTIDLRGTSYQGAYDEDKEENGSSWEEEPSRCSLAVSILVLNYKNGSRDDRD